MSLRILLIFLPFICLSCKSKKAPVSDLPPSVYEEPPSAPLRLKDKYAVNPFTGDSITPSAGYNDIAEHPTGIEIPATSEMLHPDSIGKPVSVTAGKPFLIASDTNVHYIKQPFQTIAVNELSLRKVIAIPESPVVANEVVTTAVQPLPFAALPPKIKDNTKYRILQIDESNGLPSPMINCVYEDKQGNIWLGLTKDGAIRYDGTQFFQYKSREGLQRGMEKGTIHNVQSITGDRKGNIWFGGANGITRYDGKNFINFRDSLSRMPKGLIPAFDDSAGNMWFLNFSGISKYDGKNFTNYTIDDGSKGHFMQGICLDNKGNIWVSRKNTLTRFDGESFTFFSKKDGLPGDIVYGVNCDNDGILWISTNGGITKYDGKNFVHITPKDGLFMDGLVHALQDRNGNHWFTSMDGIAKFDGTGFTHISRQTGLAGNTVFSLAEDKEGGIWVPTQHGLSRIDGSGRIFYNEPGLPPIDYSNSLVEQVKGDIWLRSAFHGIIKYDGKYFSHFTSAQGLLNDTTIGLHVDEDGKFYIKTQAGMCIFNGITFNHYRNKLFTNLLNCTLTDHQGNRWFGFGAFPATPGLIQFDGLHYKRFNRSSGLLRDVISDLFQDSKGNIWVSYMGAGVSKYDGKTFFHFTEREGLPNNDVSRILEDKQGNIWFANRGLTRFDGKKFTRFSEKQGITSEYISLFKQYGDSGFIIGNLKGVSVFEYGQNTIGNNSEKSMVPPLSFHVYPISGYQDNASLPSAFLLTKNNQLWRADGRNLLRHDLNDFATSLAQPEVRLQSIALNGKFIDFGNISNSLKKGIRFSETAGFYNYPINPVIAYSNNFLSFHYSAIEWQQAGKVKYSYKLEGLDTVWSAASFETRADYRNIPAGKYVFKVCALGSTQYWSKPFSYSFTILPPWYATWWAYLLYISGFFTSLVLFSKFRSQKLKRETRVLEEKIARRTAALSQKSEELQGSLMKLHEAQAQLIKEESDKVILKERMRVSSELHDEIGATLSGIAMYSHLVKSNLENEEPDAAKHSVNIIQDSAAEMVIKLNDIIWLTNPQQDSLKDVMVRLEEYAQNMCLAKNISPDFKIDAGVATCKTAIEIRKNIYLLCKEAINNAAKYSNAARLLLKCTIKNGLLEITIRDDGNGFNVDNVKRGNGLENMQKRADEMGAVLSIQSQPQHGCFILLNLKITQQGIV